MASLRPSSQRDSSPPPANYVFRTPAFLTDENGVEQKLSPGAIPVITPARDVEKFILDKIRAKPACEIIIDSHGMPGQLYTVPAEELGKDPTTQFDVHDFLDKLVEMKKKGLPTPTRIVFNACDVFANMTPKEAAHYQQVAKELGADIVGSTTAISHEYVGGKFYAFHPNGSVSADAKIAAVQNPGASDPTNSIYSQGMSGEFMDALANGANDAKLSGIATPDYIAATQAISGTTNVKNFSKAMGGYYYGVLVKAGAGDVSAAMAAGINLDAANLAVQLQDPVGERKAVDQWKTAVNKLPTYEEKLKAVQASLFEQSQGSLLSQAANQTWRDLLKDPSVPIEKRLSLTASAAESILVGTQKYQAVGILNDALPEMGLPPTTRMLAYALVAKYAEPGSPVEKGAIASAVSAFNELPAGALPANSKLSSYPFNRVADGANRSDYALALYTITHKDKPDMGNQALQMWSRTLAALPNDDKQKAIKVATNLAQDNYHPELAAVLKNMQQPTTQQAQRRVTAVLAMAP